MVVGTRVVKVEGVEVQAMAVPRVGLQEAREGRVTVGVERGGAAAGETEAVCLEVVLREVVL